MIQAFASHNNIYGRNMPDKVSVTISIYGEKSDIIEEFISIYDYIHDNYYDMGLYIDKLLLKRGQQ